MGHTEKGAGRITTSRSWPAVLWSKPWSPPSPAAVLGGCPYLCAGRGGHNYPHHLRMQKHYRGSQPGQRTRSSSEPSKTTSLAAPLAAIPGGREGKPPNAAGGDPPTPLRPPPPGTDRPRARSHPALGLAVHCPVIAVLGYQLPFPGRHSPREDGGQGTRCSPPGSARCRCRCRCPPVRTPRPGAGSAHHFRLRPSGKARRVCKSSPHAKVMHMNP